MNSPLFTEEVGCWKKERVLGSGGFGYVVLWRNKETNETIALKQWQWGHDASMTPNHRRRWKLEVDMMFSLDHPNVVKAIPVPPDLDVPATELPLLAMEYCSNGDLRKELNKPENCCGLKEKQVRLILRHISSAVNYLHSVRIIHRDLKPENIVIQDVNGKMVYKLIDLGYAKELDQGSLCTSFVGTLQYLAPELFLLQKYSCTVDYWSLGLVTHEVITGQRPFLPDKSPAEWIPIVKKKTSAHIRAYVDSDKNVVFSSQISPTHSICSILKKDIEEWLQLMLEWDPKKRGRWDKTTAFPLLEKILNKKVVLVCCIETCKLLSYASAEDISIENLQMFLEKETGIPVNEQELLLPKGVSLDPENADANYIANMEEEELLVFLHSKNPQNSFPSINIAIPPLVETMMRNPRVNVKYMEQREAWMHAVFLSQQECALFNRLVQAFRTNLMHLLAKTSAVHKTSVKMMGEMSKLLAKCSFFKKSLEQDLHNCKAQFKTGCFAAKALYESWIVSSENLKKIELLQSKVNILESASTNMGTRTIELQRSTYARSKQSDPLEDIYRKVVDAYGQLRKRSKEQRSVPHDNTDMVRLMCLCLQHRETQIRDIFSFIRKVSQIKIEAEDLNPQLELMLKEIADWDKQVVAWQEKRQGEMWKIVESLSNQMFERSFYTTPLQASSLIPHAPNGNPNESSMPPGPRNSEFHWNPNLPYCNVSTPRATSTSYGIGNGIPRCFPPSPSTFYSHLNPYEQPDVSSLQPAPYMHNKHLFRAQNPSISWSCRSGVGSPVPHSQPNSLHSSSQMSLACLLEKTVEDSQRIKNENKRLVESFHNMLESMKQEDLSMKLDIKNNPPANTNNPEE